MADELVDVGWLLVDGTVTGNELTWPYMKYGPKKPFLLLLLLLFLPAEGD